MKILFVLILFVVGCNQNTEETINRDILDKSGGVVNRHFLDSFVVFDPAQIQDSNSHEVCRQIYDGLVDFDSEGRIIPSIAKSWNISPDKKEYTFYLRNDIYFHSQSGQEPTANGGRQLKAQDVEYTFKRILSQEQNSQASFFWMIEGAKEYSMRQSEQIPGITVIDDLSIRFTLSRPFAPFISLLAMCNAFIVPKEDSETIYRKPAGTGPFYFKRADENYIELLSNPRYFRDAPKIEKIRFKFIADEQQAWQMFNEGKLTLMEVPDDQFKNVKQDKRKSTYLIEGSLWGCNYLGFNTKIKPFDCKYVRQAINYAIDQSSIVELVLSGHGTKAHGVLPPGLPGFNPDLTSYAYDITKAKQLLAKAGYPDGKGFPEITLQHNKDVIHARVAQFVIASLSDIGIKCRVNVKPFKNHLQSIQNNQTGFFRLGWTVDYPDPDSFLHTLFHSSNLKSGFNFFQFSDPIVDEYLEQARFETDPEKRKIIYQKAEELIVDQAPWVFLYFYNNKIIHQPDLHGLTVGPMGTPLISYRNLYFSK